MIRPESFEERLARLAGNPPPEVIAARAVLERLSQPTPCGARTKSGARCTRNRWVGTDACPSHATPEQAAAHDRCRAEATRVLIEWQRSRRLEPACWTWPVTDGDRAAVHAAGDDERALLSCVHRWQRRRCAVCGAGERVSRLVCDHDHATALVRGWLCVSCNVSEPHATDEFALYRQQNPATMLGVTARYWSDFTGWATPEDASPMLTGPNHPTYRMAALLTQARQDRLGPETLPSA